MAGKRVLILGCGLVSPPMCEYLSNTCGFNVTVASRTVSRAQNTCKNCKNIKCVEFNIEKSGWQDVLKPLVKEHDLVISLLPWIHHVEAAKISLSFKKHFCTTSYIQPAMKELDEEAKKAGIIMLNECGVDPGLDIMSAKKIIDEVHAKGGKIVSFISICGGLPAPEANTNIMGYKFSWSPRGVLLASRSAAKWFEKGKCVEITGGELFASQNVKPLTNPHPEYKGGELEWYKNRDSCSYRDPFEIPECETLIRGTIRNVGWCHTLKAIADLGLIATGEEFKEIISGKTYKSFLSNYFKTKEDLKKWIVKKLKFKDVNDDALKRMEFLGLFGDDIIPDSINTPLDALCHACNSKMQYESHEKDMLLMRHDFEIVWKDGKKQKMYSAMHDLGLQPNGYSSMARTVSLPLAIAVRLILEDKLRITGVHRPNLPELYNPILDACLKEFNIGFYEEYLPM